MLKIYCYVHDKYHPKRVTQAYFYADKIDKTLKHAIRFKSGNELITIKRNDVINVITKER